MRTRSPVITEREKMVLDAIKTHIKKYGISPSFRDIMDATGITSSSLISHYLDGLVERGYITREGWLSRAIRLTGKEVEA